MYDQPGDANFGPAPEIVEVVGAERAAQAITVISHAPGSAAAGSTFTVAATAPAGAVSFSQRRLTS